MRSPDGRWPRAREASAEARLIHPTCTKRSDGEMDYGSCSAPYMNQESTTSPTTHLPVLLELHTKYQEGGS